MSLHIVWTSLLKTAAFILQGVVLTQLTEFVGMFITAKQLHLQNLKSF